MSRRRRRKSSEEVTVEIKDSDKREKRYWNLRENKEYRYNPDSSEGHKDEINIEFNLDENRRLTEEQKQIILNTLLQQPSETNEEAEHNSQYRFDKPFILLILIALTGPILALIALSTGC